jgi:RNA polymerase sigma-70 factor (ECF subfamily)
MDDLSDDKILAKAVAGDQEAFSLLYTRHVAKIFNYIYYRTGNANDAEDLTSRVFHRAMAHIKNYRDQGVPFTAWLYRIAHNLVANWHRDNSRKKEVPLEDHSNLSMRGNLPETTLVESQEIEKLLGAIRKMNSERQQILILKFVEGMSNAEIAIIMRRSEGAIKSLYHRTLLSLRENITQMDQKKG